MLLALLIAIAGCDKTGILEMQWEKLSTGTDDDLYGIYFRNDDDGWAVTSGGKILRTNDGCKSWSAYDVGEIWLEDVYFIDDNKGFVTGSKGGLFETTDGGGTWTDRSLDSDCWFHDIAFWDDDEGVLVGAKKADSGDLVGVLYSTKDGGGTWQEVYNDMNGISDLFLSKPKLGWTICTGAVGSTTDGGENWDKNILNDDDVIRGTYFHSGQSGWIVGHSGLLAYTTDGGWSWQRKGHLTEENLYAVGFLTAFEGLAVGDRGKMFITTNGGISWNIDSMFVRSTLRDIEVAHGRIWICGDNGTIVSVHK
jgi:photosystem II stability/assembly factor-like uncharacterized protein